MKIIMDDELKIALDPLMSGLLKSEDISLSNLVYNKILRLLPIDELEVSYYIFMYLIGKQLDISLKFPKYNIILTEDILDRHIQSCIDVIIEDVSVKTFLIDVETDYDLDEAKNIIYNETMIKYKDLISMDYNIAQSTILLDTFKNACKDNFYRQLISLQGEILTSSAYFNRVKYTGIKGYEDFMASIPSFVKSRFDEFANDELVITNKKSMVESRENTTVLKKLFKLNIGGLDDYITIMESDLVSFIMKAGGGKTQITVGHVSMEALENKCGVLYLSGENHVTKIRDMHISNFFFRKTGYRVSWDEVQDKDLIEDDNVRRLLEIEELNFTELTSRENDIYPLIIRRAVYYETCYEEIAYYLKTYPTIKLVIVDDLFKMDTKGIKVENRYLTFLKDKADYMIEKLIKLGDDFNISAWVTGHPGFKTAELENAGKDVGDNVSGITNDLKKRSDLSLYGYKDKTMNSVISPRIGIKPVKLRNIKDVNLDVTLRTFFDCCHVEYHEEDQKSEEAGFEDMIKK